MEMSYGDESMGTERYHPQVAADLRDACRYYDAISSAVGNRFRANVQMKIQAIVERPESYGFIGGYFRGAVVGRFPYVVVFSIERGVMCILGVRHAASDRTTWFNRTMPGGSGHAHP